MNKLIGKRIREERLSQNLTLRQLSDRTDLTTSQLSQVELGKNAASVWALLILTAGQTVKQLPQYMHCGSSISTDLLPSTFAGRMAPVGHDETSVGISQTLGSSSWSIVGTFGTTLYLIPWLGTRMTITGAGGLLVLTAQDVKSLLAGREEDVVDALQPCWEAMGKTIVHQGGPGAGQHTKMVNQTLIASNMVGVCEALLYAAQAGLDLETVISHRACPHS